MAQALQVEPKALAVNLEQTLRWLDASPMHHLMTWEGVGYPAALTEIEDPPTLLFGIGQAAALERPLTLAVVGSRTPSPQGSRDAGAFAHDLALSGIAVVSGLARGIDTAAHEGALKANGVTIAVVGTGLDTVYPPQNTALAQAIAERGLVLSEFPLGTAARPSHFPLRNRIISGLSAGTLVVEAALKSGSLITARMALEQGKEVFAIPGSIHSPLSKGCHQLIKQGAKLVESATDILEELQGAWMPCDAGKSDHSVTGTWPVDDRSDADPLLKVMGYEALSLDELQDFTGMDTASLQVKLLSLELEQHIMRLPGGRFQRIAKS
jgi:DNA processing protein